MKAQYRKALYDCLEARSSLDFVVGRQLTDLMGSPQP